MRTLFLKAIESETLMAWSLILGIALISYHGWWLLPGGFCIGWFVAAMKAKP